MGGPQAGIIVGKKEYISKIEKNPMMRALRVGKMTLAGLTAVMKSYLYDELLIKNVPIFKFLARDEKELLKMAKKLKNIFKKEGINSELVQNEGRCGGGTLPNLTITSYAVKVILSKDMKASVIHRLLLTCEIPILSILKQGDIFFDVLTLQENEFMSVAKSLSFVMENYNK